MLVRGKGALAVFLRHLFASLALRATVVTAPLLAPRPSHVTAAVPFARGR
jgi:hypothetical protein